MAATRLSLPSIVCSVWVLICIGHRTSLAKECTNIPTQYVSHTLRSLAFDNEISTDNASSSYVRARLSPHNARWRASLTENISQVAHNRKIKTSALPEGVPKSRKEWHPADSDFNSRPEPYLVKGRKRVDMLDNFLRTRAEGRNTSPYKTPFRANEKYGREPSSNRSEITTLVGYSAWSLRGLGHERHPALREVSLHRVTLAADSLHGIAQETNLQYLLMLDVDSLVYSFRVTAGLPAPGSPYGGWEDPSMELRGHFVGHYLSATALMWASTHNGPLQENMVTLIDALAECQDQLGTGYLSAFPSEFFDRFEAIKPVWAPYYTIHKIMAGLLDQYISAGNEKALGMLLWMAEYFLRRVETVIHKFSIERHWESLNEEVGGMNDIMYRLFMLTGDPEHLKLAHLFDKPCFLGLLALQTDGLSGFHSNTHIPLVVGAQMRFEATGDELYADLSEYFMGIINTSHRYATGGTSVSEFWTYPNRNGDALSTETQETCTTYNMLKVARNMFRWTNDVGYADYYERTLVNGILGIQRGKEPGVMIYMLPQAPGTSKAVSYHGWGTPYSAFWCCYGTGLESFSKLGDSIYFEDYDTDSFTLHVAQFVSSNLTWDAVGLLLSQKVLPLVSSDPYLHITFDFYNLPQGGNGNQAELSLRIPTWTTATSLITLNGLSMEAPLPGNYCTISRAWKAGDVLKVDLGVSLALEKIQDDRDQFSSLHAILFGPYLLAGMTDGEHEIEAVNVSSLSSWIVPVPASYSDNLYSFSQNWLMKAVPDELKASDAKTLGGKEFVLSSENASPGMKLVPSKGTNEAAECTFLLTSASEGNLDDPLIGREVSFELYQNPGKLLAHTGVSRKLAVVDMGAWNSHSMKSLEHSKNTCNTSHQAANDIGCDSGFHDGYEVFKVQPGLSGDKNSVSFEAATLHGCFIASDLNGSVTLQCQSQGKGKDPNFSTAASFKVNKGIATHSPVSFFAKGKNRQFLLFPILAYQDERYATYFKLTSS